MKKLLILVVVVFGFNTFGHAGDDLTPANEGVCDDLVGEKPGLYGLCVAYCEAQDLQDTPPNIEDIDDATKEALHAEKLLGIFDKKAGPDGPKMPCVTYENVCPWTLDELEAIGTYGLTRTQTKTETPYIYFRDIENGFFYDSFNSDLLTQLAHGVSLNATSIGGVAQYWNLSNTYAPNVVTSNVSRSKVLTIEEVTECANQIRDHF